VKKNETPPLCVNKVQPTRIFCDNTHSRFSTTRRARDSFRVLRFELDSWLLPLHSSPLLVFVTHWPYFSGAIPETNAGGPGFPARLINPPPVSHCRPLPHHPDKRTRHHSLFTCRLLPALVTGNSQLRRGACLYLFPNHHSLPLHFSLFVSLHARTRHCFTGVGRSPLRRR
jgi:hypothetical protein